VKEGLLEAEARKMNEFYFKSVATSLPFVTLKLALSADGKIATSSGNSKWITGKKARRYVHELRNMHSAVLTTAETVLADDPHLGVRLTTGRDPLRIIVDRGLRLDPGKRVFRDDNFLLVTVKSASKRKSGFPEGCEANHIVFGENVALKEILMDLYRRGVGSILVEAGSRFSAALLVEKLVNKCVFFIAPKIIGGDGIPAIGGLGVKIIGECLELQNVKYNVIGTDILMEGYL